MLYSLHRLVSLFASHILNLSLNLLNLIRVKFIEYCEELWTGDGLRVFGVEVHFCLWELLDEHLQIFSLCIINILALSNIDLGNLTILEEFLFSRFELFDELASECASVIGVKLILLVKEFSEVFWASYLR